jgi:hypothetical protein
LFNRLKNEAGYSLVEVMASIVILTIAIIPMVGMFDMGLNAATKGSNYDKARSLANKQLERAKNLSYAEARDNFPTAGTAPEGVGGVCQAEISDQPDPDPEYSNFTYDVLKEDVELNDPTNPTTIIQSTVNPDGTCEPPPSKMLRITVTVSWEGNEYKTSGVKAE